MPKSRHITRVVEGGSAMRTLVIKKNAFAPLYLSTLLNDASVDNTRHAARTAPSRHETSHFHEAGAVACRPVTKLSIAVSTCCPYSAILLEHQAM